MLAAFLLPCIAFAQPADKFTDGWKAMQLSRYRLAYKCAGTGSPTLILEAPSGIAAEEAYKKLLPQLNARHKTCMLERSGLGRSDPAPAGLSQTVKDYSADLATLIRQEAPNDKLIMVGYSFGGLAARHYTAANPSNVVGLFLIDAAHEDWLIDLKARMKPDDWARMQDILDWFQRRLGHNYWDSQAEMRSVKLPAMLPVRLISRGLPEQGIRKSKMSEEGVRLYNASHDRHQFELLKVTNNTTRVVAHRSEHLILNYEPELFVEQLALLVAQTSGK